MLRPQQICLIIQKIFLDESTYVPFHSKDRKYSRDKGRVTQNRGKPPFEKQHVYIRKVMDRDRIGERIAIEGSEGVREGERVAHQVCERYGGADAR